MRYSQSDKQKYCKVVCNDFKNKKILVIGDLMVDEYVTGVVDRISPEAPIPILEYLDSYRVPGGAANVVMNLLSLGCKVSVAGVLANDEAGCWLRDFFIENGADIDGLVSEPGRPTTTKRRYRTKHQQIFRVDIEERKCINDQTIDHFISYIDNNINLFDGVILSDYSKGVLKNYEFIKQIIKRCRNKVIGVDSKIRDIEIFEGASFIKPNMKEFEAALNRGKISDDEITDAGFEYLEKCGTEALILTRSEKGIAVFEKGKERIDIPSFATQVFDVTGAGDTVISSLVLSLVCGLTYYDAAVIGNYAASLVIKKVGTATVNNKELMEIINER